MSTYAALRSVFLFPFNKLAAPFKTAPVGDSVGIRNIAIIGAGPSGIAAAKFLKAENHFSRIQIFEQRSSVGGIWNTDSDSPQEDIALFPSPVYNYLESNIPTVVMQYFEEPFPSDCPLLPNATAVLAYLKDYAKDVLYLVAFREQVLDVKCLPEQPGRWALEIMDLDLKSQRTEIFDAVVVANGRYNDPYIPEVPGLAEWQHQYPDSISHSCSYRNAESFKNKKVIIVGFSSSGVDIAAQVKPVCSHPLLISQLSAAGISPGSLGFIDGKKMVPEIISFNAQDRSVTFANGREETEVDKVVFCTGYNYDYPFLKTLPEFEAGKGYGNTQTYQHIFFTPNPSLAFVLLPLRAVAFPFAESQSAIIARVWSGRLELPSLADMEAWVEGNKASRGTGKAFHKLSYPADADYMNKMYDWCQRAKGENDGKGRVAPYWGEKERWLRRNIHEIKRATEAKWEERFAVRSIEDVGFEFKEET